MKNLKQFDTELLYKNDTSFIDQNGEIQTDVSYVNNQDVYFNGDNVIYNTYYRKDNPLGRGGNVPKDEIRIASLTNVFDSIIVDGKEYLTWKERATFKSSTIVSDKTFAESQNITQNEYTSIKVKWNQELTNGYIIFSDYQSYDNSRYIFDAIPIDSSSNNEFIFSKGKMSEINIFLTMISSCNISVVNNFTSPDAPIENMDIIESTIETEFLEAQNIEYNYTINEELNPQVFYEKAKEITDSMTYAKNLPIKTYEITCDELKNNADLKSFRLFYFNVHNVPMVKGLDYYDCKIQDNKLSIKFRGAESYPGSGMILVKVLPENVQTRAKADEMVILSQKIYINIIDSYPLYISMKHSQEEFNKGVYHRAKFSKKGMLILGGYDNTPFYQCEYLVSSNLSNCDARKTNGTLGRMFMFCNNLKNVIFPKFFGSKLIDMSNMFEWCNSLTNLDLTNFDTSNVTDMGGMFEYCRSLTSIDLSGENCDIKQDIDIYNMFNDINPTGEIIINKKYEANWRNVLETRRSESNFPEGWTIKVV